MRQITEAKAGAERVRRRAILIRRARRSAAAALVGAAGLVGLGGCEADSWFDPSVLGYWENTPTTMPILDRIAAIEDKTPDLVETTPPVREDLIAEAQQYRLGPSDDIEIRIPNIEQIGFESVYPRQIDQRGFVTIPRVGQVYLLGKTDIEAQLAISQAIESAEILQSPSVTVIIVSPRQQTYSVIGGVRNPGTYLVSKPDYRLLDAMAAAGGLDESTEKVFVVRQIALSDVATGRTAPPPGQPTTPPRPTPPVDADTLFKAIDELTQPKPTPPGNSPPGNPPPVNPPPVNPPGGGLGVMSSGSTSSGDGERRTSKYTGLQPEKTPPAPTEPKPAPPVDLIDSNEPTKATAPAPANAPAPPENADDAKGAKSGSAARSKSRWVFLNGQWTRDVAPAAPVAPQPAGADPLAGQPVSKDLMTQRVIEVPVKPLLAGQSGVNIVIRPGDVVRVPTASSGVVYVGGQVARPGTFSLPPTGKLTLLRVIDAAGGLSQLGIPERVDLTRMVGSNREATIRLNMRAIAERTQPDVILKADDRVNVGTNFWAFPIAIIRNGFRMSYGFGFLIDRNFGNDVFGPPPEGAVQRN